MYYAGDAAKNGLLTDSDLDFVVSETAQGSTDTDRLKLLIEEDEQFRAAILGNENVFQRLMADEEMFVKVSPALYFEVLLRQSLRDLETASYTVERDGRADLPVFDTPEVVRFLSIQGVLDYLAHMLASFTRINSYAVPVRIRRGIRRRVVYNDMDIDSLARLCATADWEQRFGYYKRIADVCLFISGVFPDYASPAMRYSVPNRMRTAVSDRTRRSCRTTRSRAVSSTAWLKSTTPLNTWDCPGCSACSETTSRRPASP